MRTRGNQAGRVPGIVIFLVFLAVVGAAILGAKRVFGIFGHDWQTVGNIRSRDAETVRDESQAGTEYAGKLKLSLSATRSGESAKGLTVHLTGVIANTGSKDVLKAVAEVTFLPRDPSEQSQVRSVILFDGSELSVTTDRPLGSGETRDISKNLDDIDPNWGEGKIQFKLSQVRLDIGRE